jgi:hypothetical protein
VAVGVRVVHPFHPLSGHVFELVRERRSRHGDRVWLRVGDGSVASVPTAWTDLARLEPFDVVGQGRAHFRPEDLEALADLLAEVSESRRAGPGGGDV